MNVRSTLGSITASLPIHRQKVDDSASPPANWLPTVNRLGAGVASSDFRSARALNHAWLSRSRRGAIFHVSAGIGVECVIQVDFCSQPASARKPPQHLVQKPEAVA
jgi:hypothetical protein